MFGFNEENVLLDCRDHNWFHFTAKNSSITCDSSRWNYICLNSPSGYLVRCFYWINFKTMYQSQQLVSTYVLMKSLRVNIYKMEVPGSDKNYLGGKIKLMALLVINECISISVCISTVLFVSTTLLLFFLVSHLNALQYDSTLFSITLYSCLK